MNRICVTVPAPPLTAKKDKRKPSPKEPFDADFSPSPDGDFSLSEDKEEFRPSAADVRAAEETDDDEDSTSRGRKVTRRGKRGKPQLRQTARRAKSPSPPPPPEFSETDVKILRALSTADGLLSTDGKVDVQKVSSIG